MPLHLSRPDPSIRDHYLELSKDPVHRYQVGTKKMKKFTGTDL